MKKINKTSWYNSVEKKVIHLSFLTMSPISFIFPSLWVYDTLSWKKKSTHCSKQMTGMVITLMYIAILMNIYSVFNNSFKSKCFHAQVLLQPMNFPSWTGKKWTWWNILEAVHHKYSGQEPVIFSLINFCTLYSKPRFCTHTPELTVIPTDCDRLHAADARRDVGDNKS